MIWLAIPVFSWDLSAGDGGLLPEGDTLQWAWSGAPEAGPGPADPAWATVPDGAYLNDADDSLVIDLPDLSGRSRPQLVLDQWVAVRAADRAVIEIDQGSGFEEVVPHGGYPSADGFAGTDAASATWEQVVVPLPSVAGARVRLRLVANPLLADAGWYLRGAEVVDGDVVPPLVSPRQQPADTQDLVGPYPVEVGVIDDTQVTEVLLHVRHDGVEQAPIPMTETSPGVYRGELPAPPASSLTELDWWVEASDGEQLGRYPDEGEVSFDVYLAAPTDLVADVDARFVGQEVPLVWTAPVSPNAVLDYEVRPVNDLGCDDSGQGAVVTTDTAVAWPLLADVVTCVEVVARYEIGGDTVPGLPSEVLELDAEVPQLLGLEPSSGYAGTTMWIELSGVSLYLDPAVPPDFGPGSAVTRWEAIDAHHGRAQVAWSEGAAVGPRDLHVVGLHGEASFVDAFSVDDAADAPRVLSVTPSRLTQGDETELRIVASEPFGAEVELLGGSDVFATAPATVDDSTLRLTVSVSTRARLGERTLLVDDGERLWTVPLTIDEYRVPVQKRCSTTGPEAVWMGWSLLLVGVLRRRRP